jgi:hypothetical protein
MLINIQESKRMKYATTSQGAFFDCLLLRALFGQSSGQPAELDAAHNTTLL